MRRRRRGGRKEGTTCLCGSRESQRQWRGLSKTGASRCSGYILVLGWERPSRGHTVHLSNRNTHWLISTCMAIQAPFNTVKTGTLTECYNTSSLYKKESVSHLGDCSAGRGSGPDRLRPPPAPRWAGLPCCPGSLGYRVGPLHLSLNLSTRLYKTCSVYKAMIGCQVLPCQCWRSEGVWHPPQLPPLAFPRELAAKGADAAISAANYHKTALWLSLRCVNFVLPTHTYDLLGVN